MVRSLSLNTCMHVYQTSYRYSTGSNLNTYSALVQSFYSQETHPHQAILLSVDTGLQEGGSIGIKAYVRYSLPDVTRKYDCLGMPYIQFSCWNISSSRKWCFPPNPWRCSIP